LVRQLPLSSANARAFVTTSGSRVALVYPAAVNYRSSDGRWAAIDTTAELSGSGWVQSANGWNAQLPADLGSPITITRRGAQMSMGLVGASGSGAAQSSSVSYADALTDTSVKYTYLNQALKESLVLGSASAPSTFSWDVTVPAGYSLKSSGGGVQVLDGAGNVVFDLVEPSVSDASGAVGPTPTMTVTRDGSTWVVHVVVDSSWLGSSARVWPVTVDPTVDVTTLGQFDCQITSGSGTGCAQSPLDVGYNGSNPTRMLLSWSQLNDVLPWDAQITQASVNVQVASESNGTSVPVSMYPTTTAWDDSATWTATGDGPNWSTAGGDYDSSTQTEANATVTGTGWYSFPDTTQIAQMMTSTGDPAGGGWLFKETTENVSNTLAIDSWQNSSSTNWPYLAITYSLPTGTSPSYTFVAQHRLSDNSQIEVNPVDGDVVYQVTDSNTAGVGLDQSLVRTYDSMSAGAKGDLGYGWFMDDGADTTLTAEPDGMLLRMFGNQPEFFQEVPGSPATFTTPAGFDASLVLSSGVYTLTFNDSQQVWTFGHPISSVYVLSTEKDRNGNTITFNYTCGTSCTMGTITDTEGRTTTLAHNSNGYLTSITDPTFTTSPVTRSVGYAYANGSDPNQLTGVTDADSNTTSYTYDSSENLTQITDGDGNVTELNYGSTPSAHQLQSITYAYGTSVAATWTFGYNPSASQYGGSTSVTDPKGNITVYDYDNQGEVLSVTDPLGNQRSTTWTANADPNVLSDAIGSADNSTLTWNATNGDSESSALASSNGTNAPATWTNGYNGNTASNGGGSVAGSAYLPSSSTDPQGNCTNNVYDSSGNVTASDAGGVTSGGPSGTCSSTIANSSFAYDGDGSTTCTGASTGELCSQEDPNSQTTSFGYDSHGNLASTTPPSPDGYSTDTYDGASRIISSQDGNGTGGAAASIVPVQSATQNVGGTASSQTVTLSSNVTAGDTLVMTVVGNPVSGTLPVVSSITGGGVSWVRGTSGGNATVGDDEVWYGLDSSGGSGTTTLTITMTASTPGIGAWVGEFTGIASSSALDTSGSNSGTGTTLSEPSMTTTSNGDLILATTNGYNIPGSPPASPWTDVAGPEYPGLYTPLAYRTLATAGAVPVATWTQSTGPWATAAIALKPASESVSTTYDKMDRVTQTIYGGDTACVPSSGNCITYGYDDNGNLTSMTDSTGTTSWTYDAMGRVTKKALPSSANACSGQTGMTYTYDKDGNLTAYCDASGTTNYTYDAANNNTSVTEPGGTSGCKIAKSASPAPIQAVQSATQNVGSSSISSQTVTLPSNVTAGDALVMTVVGNPVSGTLPVVSSITGGGVSWVRGTSGGNSTVGDDEIWYGLNSSGGSGTTTLTITMTASTPGIGAWVGEYTGIAASSALDTSGSNSGTGATLSEPSMTTTTGGDLILATTNGYDIPGDPPAPPTWTDVAGPAYAGGGLFTPLAYTTLATAGAVPVATWTQDSSPWATAAVALKPATQAAVSQNLTTGCTGKAYDQDGRLTTTQFPGGATQTTSYTNAGLVSEIKATNSSGSTITDYKYSYTTGTNDTSLVQTRVENDPSTSNTNLTTTYSYDALNRLTEAVASSGTSYYYGYDLDGNMNCSQTSGVCSGASSGSCSSHAFAYNNDDELTCDTAGSFSYDADGNNTSTPTLSALTYNPINQMSSVTQSGTTTTYGYTGTDSSQRTAAGSTTFIADGDQVLESTTGGTATYYTYDGTGNLIGFRTGGASYYYLYDNVGSVMAVISSSGTISDRYTYTPYGVQTITTSGVSNPAAFQSGYQDTTGLIKYGDRYYNPAADRWTQPDPAGQDPGYVFDGDNPVNEADPSGNGSVGACGSLSVNQCNARNAVYCKAHPKGNVPETGVSCQTAYGAGSGFSLGCALTVAGFIPFAGDVPLLGKEAYNVMLEGKGILDGFNDLRESVSMRLNLAGSYSLAGGFALGGC
jgi:RHS repeat-associated protein